MAELEDMHTFQVIFSPQVLQLKQANSLALSYRMCSDSDENSNVFGVTQDVYYDFHVYKKISIYSKWM